LNNQITIFTAYGSPVPYRTKPFPVKVRGTS
jgi:hypothetical protein